MEERNKTLGEFIIENQNAFQESKTGINNGNTKYQNKFVFDCHAIIQCHYRRPGPQGGCGGIES